MKKLNEVDFLKERKGRGEELDENQVILQIVLFIYIVLILGKWLGSYIFKFYLLCDCELIV